MKKLLIAGLALITILALTGCGASSYSRGGYTKQAEGNASSLLSDKTGQTTTAANSETYAMEISGAEAAIGYGIRAENLLGSGYISADYEKIGIALSVNKEYTVAVMSIVFVSAKYTDTVNLTQVGALTAGNPLTGVTFVAQDMSGVKVNVSALKVAGRMVANIKLASSSAFFAQATPLPLMIPAP